MARIGFDERHVEYDVEIAAAEAVTTWCSDNGYDVDDVSWFPAGRYFDGKEFAVDPNIGYSHASKWTPDLVEQFVTDAGAILHSHKIDDPSTGTEYRWADLGDHPNLADLICKYLNGCGIYPSHPCGEIEDEIFGLMLSEGTSV